MRPKRFLRDKGPSNVKEVNDPNNFDKYEHEIRYLKYTDIARWECNCLHGYNFGKKKKYLEQPWLKWTPFFTITISKKRTSPSQVTNFYNTPRQYWIKGYVVTIFSNHPTVLEEESTKEDICF